MARAQHVTLDDVREELARGGIVEAPISAPGEHVAGYCDRESGIVCINPAPELADSIIHELTHRRWPRWGEARVKAETRRLLSHMSDEDVSSLVTAYRRRRHKRRRVRVLTAA
jgi:hypothetical protein